MLPVRIEGAQSVCWLMAAKRGSISKLAEGTAMRIVTLALVATMAIIGWGLDCEKGAERPRSPETSIKSAVTLSGEAGPEKRGWVPLFNGRNLDGWYTFLQKHGKNSDPDRVITIEDGTIHLYKDAADESHVVMGYIGTEKEYGNYHFRLQYRWGTKKFEPRYKLKRDAGLYYHILGPDAVWPRALQFQIEQTNVGDLIALHGIAVDTWIDPKTRTREYGHLSRPETRG